MIRTGKQYLQAIDDGRVVWFSTEEVHSVVTAAPFSRGARAFASLYDRAATHPTVFYGTATDGTSELLAFQSCRTLDQLHAKHEAHASWAEASFGFLGRTPDYMATGLAGATTAPEALQGEAYDGRASFQALYERARSESLFLSFTLTNIRRDKTKPLSEQDAAFPDIGVRVVRETDGGILVSGVKGVGTAAIYSDELIVGSIDPLQARDAAYALTFCIRPSTPGVTLISRDSYSWNREFVDAPLSSAWDENDAILVLKDVFVPWERVLTYRDARTTFELWWGTAAYTSMAHQASIRFYKKLEFLAGLAHLIVRSNGSLAISQVRATLGRLVGYAQIAKSIAMGAERDYEKPIKGDHVLVPNRQSTCAQRIFAAEVYPKVVHELRMLAGGSLAYLPTAMSDLSDPRIGDVIGSYWEGKDLDAYERARLFKLVWDATSSEFGARHAHYEQFYQGAPHVYFSQMTEQTRLDELSEYASRAMKDI